MASTVPTKWQRAAERVGELLPLEALNAEVRRFVAPGADGAKGRWVLACSGGSDSVALVLVVWAHWPKKRGQLVLAHFDHRLRGRASTADAAFCARLAKGLGVHFETARWTDVPAEPSEAAARTARHTFLEGVCRRHRARVVWTGHQQDDVAETMLMRLARGSGTAGLAAPRPVQETGEGRWRVRPLLDLARGDLQERLTAAGVAWREDESNTTGDYFRNRIRADVLPAWVKAARRDAVAGAALSRELLAEDEAALDAWLAELRPIEADGALMLKRLQRKPKALWRRALRAWLSLQADPGDLSRQGFENLLEMVMAGRARRFSLGKQGFARIRQGRLFFQKLPL